MGSQYQPENTPNTKEFVLSFRDDASFFDYVSGGTMVRPLYRCALADRLVDTQSFIVTDAVVFKGRLFQEGDIVTFSKDRVFLKRQPVDLIYEEVKPRRLNR